MIKRRFLPLLLFCLLGASPLVGGSNSAYTAAYQEQAPRLALIQTFEDIDAVFNVDFSPDGETFLYSGCELSPDSEADSFDCIKGMAVVRSVSEGLLASLEGEKSIYNGIMTSGQKLIYSDDSGNVEIIDIASDVDKSFLYYNSGYMTGFALNPDETLVALGSGRGNITVLELDTGSIVFEASIGSDDTTDLAFSPDGNTLIAMSWDGMGVFDLEQERDITEEFAVLNEVWQGLEEPMIVGSAFSMDSHYLAISGCNGTDECSLGGIVFVINLETNEIAAALTGGAGLIDDVVFTPDGRWLIGVDWEGYIRVWNVKTWEEASTVRGHTGIMMDIAISADGHYLLTSDVAEGLVRLWEISME